MTRTLIILIVVIAIGGGGYYYYMQQQGGAGDDVVAEAVAACEQIHGVDSAECQCLAEFAEEGLTGSGSKKLLRDVLKAEVKSPGSGLQAMTSAAVENLAVTAEVGSIAAGCEIDIPDPQL